MNFICGLDIDRSQIVGILAKVDRHNNILDIYIEKTESRGFSKGKVFDSVAFSECISKLVTNLEYKSANPIRNVFIAIKGDYIKVNKINAAIPLSESTNKVVRSIDVKKVNKFAHDLGLDLNEEVIYELPHRYKIDNHDDIQEPIGLSGHKLNVDLFLVKADFFYLENLREALRHIGINTSGLVLSGLATASSVLDNNDKTRGVTLIDISDDIVEILNFSNAKLLDYRSLSLGYNGLNEALAEQLGISFEIAGQINNSYGIINMPEGSRDEEIVVKKDFDYVTFKKSFVSGIITEKTRHLLSLINNELAAIKCLSGNIIITGEISLVEGFIELAELILERSLKLGHAKDAHLIPYFESIWALRALGLVKYSLENRVILEKEEKANPFSELVTRARDIYQDYF